MLSDNNAAPRPYSKLLISTALATFLLGILVIASWLLDITPLEGHLDNYIVMKFNTALCFILAGVCFWFAIKHKPGQSTALYQLPAVCFGLFAALVCTQYLFNWPQGIDQFFIKDHHSVKQSMASPGRMSPSTAVSFILMAVSFLFINSRTYFLRAAAQYMLHAVTIIAFIALLGYILKVPYTLKFQFFSMMGINTAACFLFFSAAATAINPALGVTLLFTGKRVGDIIARKLFPRLALVLIAISYVSLELQRNDVISSEFGLVLTATAFLLIALYLVKGTLNEMNRIDATNTENKYAIKSLRKSS